MVVHELKNDISTVRIHDEFYDADSKRLINSASRVVSESYKRRYLSQEPATSPAFAISEHQPTVVTL